MARPRMHCALLLSLAAIASSQDVYLGEDLNVTMYDGLVAACSHPEVAKNNTCTCSPGFTWTDNVCTSCALGSYKEEAGQHAGHEPRGRRDVRGGGFHDGCWRGLNCETRGEVIGHANSRGGKHGCRQHRQHAQQRRHCRWGVARVLARGRSLTLPRV